MCPTGWRGTEVRRNQGGGLTPEPSQRPGRLWSAELPEELALCSTDHTVPWQIYQEAVNKTWTKQKPLSLPPSSSSMSVHIVSLPHQVPSKQPQEVCETVLSPYCTTTQKSLQVH